MHINNGPKVRWPNSRPRRLSAASGSRQPAATTSRRWPGHGPPARRMPAAPTWSSSASRAAIPSRAACSRRCTAAGSGRCASTPDSAPRRRPTSATTSCSSSGQTGLSVAFDLPTQMGYDSPDPMALGEVGKVGVAIDTLDDMRTLLRRHPAGQGHDQHDDQRARRSILLGDVPAGGRGAGRQAGAAGRHDPERHPQGIHGARDLHLPARAEHACSPSTSSATAAQVLPQWNMISISGYHIREAGCTAVQEVAFTLADGIEYVQARDRGRAGRRRLRRALELLLQRAQQPPRRSGQVPRRAAAVGAHHARALRRAEPQELDAALPHADRGQHADGAAAAEQHRARGLAGARRRARRDAEPAHQQLRRGAGAAQRAKRGDRAAHAADHRARERRRPTPSIRWAARGSSRT